MQRDNFACTECLDKFNNLQVHHDYYTYDTMPWDYPDNCYRTLCELCHTKEEFYKWMNRKGRVCLIKLGLTLEETQEVVEMICRRVKENLYSDDVLLYMEDLKRQLDG